MATTNVSTTKPRSSHMQKASKAFTPSQLAILTKGPKVTVILVPDDDRFVGLEGAAVDLLAHFLPYAHQKLIDERATTLYISNGYKKPIVWIYKYMRAGETDATDEEPFETLAFDNLISIYTHSSVLRYQHLMDRVVGRLKSKYATALPSIDELRTFSDSVPPVYDYCINDVLAHEMANPWTCSYSAYTNFAASNSAFSDALGAAIQRLLAHRVKIGTEFYERTKDRRVAISKAYYANIGKPGAAAVVEKMNNQGNSKPKYAIEVPAASNGQDATSSAAKAKRHQTRKPETKKVADASEVTNNVSEASLTQNKKPKAKKASKCFTCGTTGHFARDCTAPAQRELVVPEPGPPATKPIARLTPKVKEPFLCYSCGEDGHMARNCTAEVQEAPKKSKRPPPVCYNCNEEGHLAHNCTMARKEDANVSKRATRDTTGRNHNFRRAQNDRAVFIDVDGNGEGLRTCDREVRQGEMTRAGLLI